MEKEQRTRLQKATQDARRLLEEEFRSQLLQTYDIDVEKVRWAEEPGVHLLAEQRLIREKLVAWIEHKQAQIQKDNSEAERKKAKTEALLLALREMAFTALNRFVALKLMEARELVRPCVSGGLESAGFLEFTAVAQGLLADQESSYRLYLETIFEDVSRELRALFDPRDPASLLWPKRAALLELLDILNRPELAELWSEDETLGWVYQYFNGDAERKRMREESSAPRNSRELAVRNQFFTPRYVVEFLTDNTLGQIWYEMRQGNTRLKDRCRYLVRRPNEIWLQPGEVPSAEVAEDEGLNQEEALQKPVHIAYRPLKDPREIRMLDPACGSMHFGLYAFDLYLEIYEEAWEIAQASEGKARQSETFAPFVEYAAGFSEKASFLREVPRLILLHNIHGIDIDPRATQIAKLTLWLRAQRTWQEQRLDVADRPPITRSNVVCAEPMPGERELLADFADEQFPDEQGEIIEHLLAKVFEQMELAGEAGILLDIEERIREASSQAKVRWERLGIIQRDLFAVDDSLVSKSRAAVIGADFHGVSQDFWVDIEDKIYAALDAYAEKAESGNGLERRLFAEDSAQGFAFVDVCRKRYDVVLTNPPFGDPTEGTLPLFQSRYTSCKGELYACFVAAAKKICTAQNGILGCITSRTGLFLPSMAQWRQEYLLGSQCINTLADLGAGVLDNAMVETSAYTVRTGKVDLLIALKASECSPPERPEKLYQAASLKSSDLCYPRKLDRFSLVPDAPLAYWADDSLLALFSRNPSVKQSAAVTKQGLATAQDARFLRTWWELPNVEPAPRCESEQGEDIKQWVPFCKGGAYSPFFSDIQLVVNWRRNGEELRARINPKSSKPFSNIWQLRQTEKQFFFKPGLTFPFRAPSFSTYLMPSRCIFAHIGQTMFSQGPSLYCILGVTNSSVFRSLVGLRLGREDLSPHFTPETVNPIAWPSNIKGFEKNIAQYSERIARLRMEEHMADETSLLFDASVLGHAESVASWLELELEQREIRANLIADLLDKLNAEVCAAYEFHDDYQTASSEVRSWPHLSASPKELRDASLFFLSLAIGVMFGRWSTGAQELVAHTPVTRDILDPLPLQSSSVCINGGYLAGRSLPADSLTEATRQAGIFAIDHSACRDFDQSLSGILSGFLQADSDNLLAELANALFSPSVSTLFLESQGFFQYHLSRYTKGSRQAPIYWQLSAGTGACSVWLYYHRFTVDTIYRVLRDFVEPRIQQAERDQLEFESQGSLSVEAATQLHNAQILLQDLRLLKSELDLVAPLWNPNLNDGVIINHAILWRITPYTPWQKKCKECWDKLEKGDYDWAHLAFHLWPERVIRSCTTDRSLAIAHGLEERLWQETNNGNWLPRQLSEADLQALIAEHSNPAVKSALERFLAAPPPVAPTRTRASRGTSASGSSAPRRPRGTAAVVDAEATRQVLLALTAAPSDGLAKGAIADLIGVEANALTVVIKQLKESGQIDQLGERRGARYVLSEQGRAKLDQEEAG
jgi:hypothetical protein